MTDVNTSAALAGTTTLPGEQRLHAVRSFVEQDTEIAFNPVALLLRLLRGRWLRVTFLVLIFALLFGLAGFIAVKPVYQSQGMVRISARESTILYADADDARLKLFDAFVSGEVTYLGSRPVMQRALGLLALSSLAPDRLPQDVSSLSRMTTITRNKGLILVAGRSGEPSLSAAVVNAVVDSYLALHSEQESGRQSYRERELVARERELLSHLEVINARTLDVGGEYGMDSLLKAHIAKISQIEELEQRSDELARTIDQLESVGRINDADTGDTEIKRAMLLDRALADMTYDRAKRAAALETLNQRYRSTNPIVQRAVRELAVLDKAIDQRREQISTLGRTGALTDTTSDSRNQSSKELMDLQDKLLGRLDVLREEAKGLNGKLVELRFLQEERTGVRVLLDETRRVLDQVRVESRNSLPGVVEVLSRGSLPDAPVEDKRPQIMILGAGLGGGLAFALFIGLTLMRPTLRFSDDLESLTSKAPLVATLPYARSAEESSFHAAVDRLRNTVQLLPIDSTSGGSGARIVAITGLSDSCGVTELSRTLSSSFAQSGHRTLLIDADLLTPDLSERMEADKIEGWRDLLGSREASPQPVRVEDSLDLLPIGICPAVQDTGVSLPRLRNALERVSRDYDLLLLDLGTYHKRLAAGLIASQADLTIVVSRPGGAVPQLRRILGQLDRIAPGALCQVFNFAARRDPEIAADFR